MWRAKATKPTLNTVSTTVAMTNPPGAPSPLPNPTATGRLPVMAVIGAENATTMNTTPASPIAPRFRVARPGSAPTGAATSGTDSTAITACLSLGTNVTCITDDASLEG